METTQENNRYTPTEIGLMDGGVLTLGDQQLGFMVAFALSDVPSTVVDRVLSGCLFVVARYVGDALFIPEEVLRGKAVIVLPERMLGDDMEEIKRIIVYGVARFYLGFSMVSQGNIERTESQMIEDLKVEGTVGRWRRGSRA